MFWKNFVNLCNEKNISPNAVCAKLGYSAATATKWKNGATPRDTTLKKIADYFGVTPDTLIALPPSDEGGVTSNRDGGRDFSQDELQLIDAYRKLDLKGKSKVLNYIFEITDAIEVIKSTKETAGTSI